LHKALQGKPKDYVVNDFAAFAGLIDIHFNQNELNPVDFYLVPQPADQGDSLEVLRALMHMGSLIGTDESMPQRLAKAQLMALMLNVVSGKVSQTQAVSEDGRTISQAVTYCDLLIGGEIDPPSDGGPGDGSPWHAYIRANYILNFVNLGLNVLNGVIPEDVWQIAYKSQRDEILPKCFSLDQNYPNPFNPVTEISFYLPKATHVTVDVFNLLGQRVEILINGDYEAGQHSVSWDASDHSSGVYFYRLQTEDAVESEKMILLK
jgi:hypothetical protein